MSGETIGMFFLSVAIIASLIICVLFCNNICKSEAVPAYSAPIIVTSQTHQAPGSSRTTAILNQNSRPPGHSPLPSPRPFTNSPGFAVTGSNSPYPPMNASSPYPPQSSYNPQSPYPQQSGYPQQMPLPSAMPYPSATSYTASYPPQIGSNVPQGQQPSAPQPSAPYPTNFSLEQMDVPPNYDEAMTVISKEQKKL